MALKLPRVDKLRLMEALWDDLSHRGVEVDSPDWHEAVLRETEKRVASGEETPLDWGAAKRHLRSR